MPKQTHYDVLGVDRKADAAVIQAAYDKILASRNAAAAANTQAQNTQQAAATQGAAVQQGDLTAGAAAAGEQSDEALKKKELQDREDEAYRVLMDEKERAKYDAELAEQATNKQSNKPDEANQTNENAMDVVSPALREAGGPDSFKQLMAMLAIIVASAEKRLNEKGSKSDSILSQIFELSQKWDAVKTWAKNKVSAMTGDTPTPPPPPAKDPVAEAASSLLSAAGQVQEPTPSTVSSAGAPTNPDYDDETTPQGPRNP